MRTKFRRACANVPEDPKLNGMITRCRACDSAQLRPLLDCGDQPVDYHFPSTKEDIVARHPLVLGFCESCELVQWLKCQPRSAFAEDPFVYREPEFHLDRIADQILALRLPPAFRIGCLSEKDRSLAERLVRAGGTLAEAPPYDLLLSRHIAEHADSLTDWLKSWREQLSELGYLYLEVPDASAPLEAGDVTVLWEQHQIYFSPITLQRALAAAGFHSNFLSLPQMASKSEDLLALVANTRQSPIWPASQGDSARARAFPLRLARQKKLWTNLLDGKKVAALGAGHDLVTFLNSHHLADRLDFVADDHPRKLGHYLPGTELPIFPVTAIRRSRTDVCLLGVMAESEPKVLARLADFREEGGQVLSIYHSSTLAPRTPLPELP